MANIPYLSRLFYKGSGFVCTHFCDSLFVTLLPSYDIFLFLAFFFGVKAGSARPPPRKSCDRVWGEGKVSGGGEGRRRRKEKREWLVVRRKEGLQREKERKEGGGRGQGRRKRRRATGAPPLPPPPPPRGGGEAGSEVGVCSRDGGALCFSLFLCHFLERPTSVVP